MRSGKRRCSASGMCALIVRAARKKRLLRDEHGHAAEWLPISVCKKKCMLLCTLASLNECVGVSTRRETSHIDRPLRLAAPASRTPAPCSAAARRARCAFYRRARNRVRAHRILHTSHTADTCTRLCGCPTYVLHRTEWREYHSIRYYRGTDSACRLRAYLPTHRTRTGHHG